MILPETRAGLRLTLVVTVYNTPRPLGLIFDALDDQTFGAFELIVADDGSGPDVGDLVARRGAASRFPVSHVWHEDRGFRRSAILNRAIAAASTGYIVFADGDCIPHRKFLEDHASLSAPGTVLCGRRVNIGKEMSERLLERGVGDGRSGTFAMRLLIDGLMGRSTWVEDVFRTTNPLLRKLLHPGKPAILGCNFSVHREWLERVNGFNEEYEAYGLEDSDLGFRLGLAGATLAPLRNLGILFHLHHPQGRVTDANRAIYERVVSSREMVCRDGLVKLSSPVYAD